MAYQVIKFNKHNLRGAFSNQHVSRESLRQFRKLDYLHGYLANLHCATIVIEHDYVDGDYLDDYAQYYAKCFKSYNRHCKRLHFFSNEFSRDEFTSLITERISKQREQVFYNAYLGFVVAKPLPEVVIGRTVLKTYPIDGGRRNFHAIRDYRVNLYGFDFKVESLGFMEQDRVVGACATSSLWSAFQKTCPMFGRETPTPATITRLATRYFLTTRALPSHGLNLGQLCEGIRAIGLEPEVFKVNPSTPLLSIIYGYLRAGLPAILAIDVGMRGLHAVTVLGYSVESSPIRESEVMAGYPMIPLTGLSISKFYVHDDQIGPFARMDVHAGHGYYPVRFKGTWSTPTGQEQFLNPVFVIIPVYHKIRIRFPEVARWPKRFEKFFQYLGWVVPSGPLMLQWDIFLSTVNELKSNLRYQGNSDLVPKRIFEFSHPRFIWRVQAFHGGIPLFEMLADATDTARSFFPYFIWFKHPVIHNLIHTQVGKSQWNKAVSRYLTPKFIELIEAAV